MNYMKNGHPVDTTVAPGSLRLSFGFWLSIAGFALVAVTVVISAVIWANRGAAADAIKFGDVTSLVATVTGIVGTVIGAFFGVNASGAARDQMNLARQSAQQTSDRALAYLPEEKADLVLGGQPSATPPSNAAG